MGTPESNSPDVTPADLFFDPSDEMDARIWEASTPVDIPTAVTDYSTDRYELAGAPKPTTEPVDPTMALLDFEFNVLGVQSTFRHQWGD